MSAEEEFREAMTARGLVPPKSLVADGRIHRCGTAEKPHGKTGAYSLHLDERPCGGFEHHGDGAGWQKWRPQTTRPLTPTEAAEMLERVRRKAAEREAQMEDERRAAIAKAQLTWARASERFEHPYLERKGVRAHGLRCRGELLLVPIFIGGNLSSLQYISPDGTKRFAKGAPLAGGYHWIGSHFFAEAASSVCISEGYATAASIYESTGYPTVVAFNCGNLMAVAERLAKACPLRRLIVCADDDAFTAGNPGLMKARQVSERMGIAMAVPRWSGERGKGTDFNDLAASEGPEAVRRCLASAAPVRRGP